MTAPTVADFKTFFARDFPFGDDPATSVTDADITKAIARAGVQFNGRFFSDDANATTGYLYLSAHYLVMSFRASSGGLSASFSWAATSTSVGSVSQSVQIPQMIMDNPIMSLLANTPYGVEYLTMIMPYLYGNVFVVCGGTTA